MLSIIEALRNDADVPYRLVSQDLVEVVTLDGRSILKIEAPALSLLAETAFHDLSFMMQQSHLQQLANIVDDEQASDNDRFVAHTLLQNAVVAANGKLPICQDTGTAIAIGLKGQNVWTRGNDYLEIERGVENAYKNNNLRYSQVIATQMYSEVCTENNLPAQVEINAVEGDEFQFLFVAKGGGSANKTKLFQETKALLNPAKLEPFLLEKIRELGTTACPPYHIAIVVGGTSAEENLRVVKLASTKCLDTLPIVGDSSGRAFRDVELEGRLLLQARALGLGAQFGGVHFALDFRVIRLSRHAASCPVGIGVSCVAHRNIRAKINRSGLWVERLENHPEHFLCRNSLCNNFLGEVIDLDQPMPEILAQLARLKVGTRLLLNGTLIVARDQAHARFKALADSGAALPEYLKQHPVFYAGPAKTPAGCPSGSLGPTTAGRMDGYLPQFQQLGACLVTIAKGNRSHGVTECCKRFGGFYLGSIGGAAALLAQKCIKSSQVIDFPDLGMEAVHKIQVVDFPAFVLIDDKGNSFYDDIL